MNSVIFESGADLLDYGKSLNGAGGSNLVLVSVLRWSTWRPAWVFLTVGEAAEHVAMVARPDGRSSVKYRISAIDAVGTLEKSLPGLRGPVQAAIANKAVRS